MRTLGYNLSTWMFPKLGHPLKSFKSLVIFVKVKLLGLGYHVRKKLKFCSGIRDFLCSSEDNNDFARRRWWFEASKIRRFKHQKSIKVMGGLSINMLILSLKNENFTTKKCVPSQIGWPGPRCSNVAIYSSPRTEATASPNWMVC